MFASISRPSSYGFAAGCPISGMPGSHRCRKRSAPEGGGRGLVVPTEGKTVFLQKELAFLDREGIEAGFVVRIDAELGH